METIEVDVYISTLVQYGIDKKLIEPCDKAFIINQLLSPLQLDSYEPAEVRAMSLEQILKGLTDYAVDRGIIADDITSRDLFDTKLMGVLTPPPREVRGKFAALYEKSPEEATDWYYRFSQDTDYINHIDHLHLNIVYRNTIQRSIYFVRIGLTQHGTQNGRSNGHVILSERVAERSGSLISMIAGGDHTIRASRRIFAPI